MYIYSGKLRGEGKVRQGRATLPCHILPQLKQYKIRRSCFISIMSGFKDGSEYEELKQYQSIGSSVQTIRKGHRRNDSAKAQRDSPRTSISCLVNWEKIVKLALVSSFRWHDFFFHRSPTVLAYIGLFWKRLCYIAQTSYLVHGWWVVWKTCRITGRLILLEDIH